jgi:hypothetical protein
MTDEDAVSGKGKWQLERKILACDAARGKIRQSAKMKVNSPRNFG